MLGEITHDDTTYTGDDGSSVFSVQYYRNKASEFQAVMTALEQGRESLLATLDTVFDEMDSDLLDSIQIHLSDIEDKRGSFIAAAEALNAASQTINSAGVRFPVMSIPSGLGLGPLAIAGIVAGALAAAGSLVYWGVEWLQQSYLLQTQAQALAAASTPEVRDAIASQIVKTSGAIALAENPLSVMAGSVKWLAIGAVALIGFKLYTDHQNRRG